MIGGRSALLAAGAGLGYGNWTGNYSDVSLLLRNGTIGTGLVPLDESPTPKTITTFGNAGISTTTFKYGDSSLVFDGAGDYLMLASNEAFAFGTGDFTVEAWIYLIALNGPNTASYIADFRPGSASNFTFGIINSGGNPRMYAFANESGVVGTLNASLNTWNHVAFVRNASTITLYLNGTQNGTMSSSVSQSATGIILACRYSLITEFFNGYIDDLRITKGVARHTSNFSSSLPAELPANATDDPHYSDVSLLLRNGAPALIPLDESPTPKAITAVGNASVTTAVAKWNQGSGGSSLRLLGSPDVLSVPKLGLISTDFTIEFWIYLLDGGVANQVICTTYNAPTQVNTFIVSRSSPGNIILFQDPYGVASASTALPLATWTHIACVYIHSTRNYRIFVNGIGSTSATGTAITAEAANFFIGGSPGDNFIGSWYLNARIDDFRVTKLARYTKNFLPPPAELPAI